MQKFAQDMDMQMCVLQGSLGVEEAPKASTLSAQKV